MSTSIEASKKVEAHTEATGRILAYKSRCFRKATMGEE
jgi:hypothetical protein